MMHGIANTKFINALHVSGGNSTHHQEHI